MGIIIISLEERVKEPGVGWNPSGGLVCESGVQAVLNCANLPISHGGSGGCRRGDCLGTLMGPPPVEAPLPFLCTPPNLAAQQARPPRASVGEGTCPPQNQC